MIKKTIVYTSLDGVRETDTLYFNLPIERLLELEEEWAARYEEKDFAAVITKLTESKNGTEIIRLVTRIVKASYGERGPDGKTFVQNDEISAQLANRVSYHELIKSFVMDPEGFGKFVEAILPDIRPAEPQVTVAPIEEKLEKPAANPLLGMSPEEVAEAVRQAQEHHRAAMDSRLMRNAQEAAEGVRVITDAEGRVISPHQA